ncbi:MAG: hypothetical protein ACYCYP_05260 [Leptospirales bacterium]
MTESKKNDCFGQGVLWVRELPGRLLVYDPGNRKSWDRAMIRAAFVIAAVTVVLFSAARFFDVHWGWLVPVSISSMVFLMTVLLVTRMRERPVYAIRVGHEGFSQELLPSNVFVRKRTVFRAPLSDISLESVSGEIPNEGFRLKAGGEVVCECRMTQVKDVSLYLGVLQYFSMDPDVRPAIPSRKIMFSKGKLFWLLFSWGFIALILVVWWMYEKHIELSVK